MAEAMSEELVEAVILELRQNGLWEGWEREQHEEMAHAILDAVLPLVAQPQLTDEYGLRIRHVSTLTEERAIADTLGGALEVLAAFDAKGREGVVSRELLVRGVEEWRKVAEG